MNTPKITYKYNNPSEYTLYVISDMGQYTQMTTLEAYQLIGSSLSWAGKYTLDFHGAGAVGMALDDKNDKVFVTWEGSGTIDVFDATSLTPIGSIPTPGTDLAGIVVDTSTDTLYAVDRGRTTIYMYDTSTYASKGTGLITVSAWGLAIDNKYLYVTDRSNNVTVYDKSFTKVDIYNIGYTAIGIAVDSSDQSNVIIYAADGSRDGCGVQLTKYETATRNVTGIVTGLQGPTGVTVNPDTQMVYITTGRCGGKATPSIQAYDAATLTLQDTVALHEDWAPTDLFIGKVTFTPSAPGCFCGIYRNFDTDREDFGGSALPHCTPRPCGDVETELVKHNLPWRPSDKGLSFSPNFAEPSDWYRTPSSVIRIDPAEPVTATGFPPGSVGLDMTFLTDGCKKEPDFPEELDEGLRGDPCQFTVHWETTITVTQETDVTFTATSDDDFWGFVDGELVLDLGGNHVADAPGTIVSETINFQAGTTHTIDLFYAERYGSEGIFRFGISPGPPTVIINCPSHVCAKKSFEDLLKHHAERIKSFEDLLKSIPPDERTLEQLQSFENLLVEQEKLLEDFEELIMMELPALIPPPPGLHESELIILLDSLEDLLHKQCELIKSFEDLLYESEKNFDIEKFSELLSSQENLTESQEKLLESFEMFLEFLYYDLDIDQKIYFLRSFEDLLKSQYELIKSFEDLLKIRLPEMSANQKNEFLESFERLLKSQSGLIENFANILDQIKDEFSTDGIVMTEFAELLFSLEDLIRNQDKLLKSFEDLLEIVFPEMSSDQKNIFLESFEDLLMNQSELLKKFENLLEWWLKHEPIHTPST